MGARLEACPVTHSSAMPTFWEPISAHFYFLRKNDDFRRRNLKWEVPPSHHFCVCSKTSCPNNAKWEPPLRMIFDHSWKKKAAPQKTPKCFARISEKSAKKFFLVSLEKNVYFSFQKLTF